MRVFVSWESHNRRYSIDLVYFLKTMGINVDDAKLKATARKLLEQNEFSDENPKD